VKAVFKFILGSADADWDPSFEMKDILFHFEKSDLRRFWTLMARAFMYNRDQSKREAKVILKLIFLLLFTANGFGHGTLHEQLSNLSREIAKSPDSAELYLKRGEVYRNHKDWKKAATDYEKARALKSELPGLDLADARLYYDSGRYGMAKASVNKHLNLHPQDENARHLRAKILVGLKQWEDSIGDYTFFIANSKAPQPQAFIDRADAQVHAGKPADAITGLEEGIERLGPLISFQEAAIRLELQAKRYDQALARVESVLNTLSRKEQWLAKKGEILETAGKREEAKQTYLQVLKEIEGLPASHQGSKAMLSLKAEMKRKLK